MSTQSDAASTIEFQVRGLPVPQGSAKAFPNPKTGGSIVVTQTPKLKAWREAIASEARRAVDHISAMLDDGTGDAFHEPRLGKFELIESAVCVSLLFSFDKPKSRKKEIHMRTRPDLDKLIRAVLDGCTNVIWKDDSQVCHITATKIYGVPGVVVRIMPTTEEQRKP